jgi:DNA-binding GntR family transcriptional regulator
MSNTVGSSFKSVSDGSLSSVKGNVAEFLLEEIINGRLKPGERIVEGKWASKLHVAQASVREALNILSARGFVEKDLGRSARVTILTDDDIQQIYVVRAALESLAARLVATLRPDLKELDLMMSDMNSSVQCRDMRSYFERVVAFHLLLCEKSGNRFILENIRRMLVPLHAFILLRRNAVMNDGSRWYDSFENHKRILQVVQSGDPDRAESEVRKIIETFATRTAELLAAQHDPEPTNVSGR